MKNNIEGKFKPGIFVKKDEIKKGTEDPIKDQIEDMFREAQTGGKKIETSEHKGEKLGISRNPKYPTLEELDGDNKDDKEPGE